MYKVLVVGKALQSSNLQSVLDRFNCKMFQADSNDEAYSIHCAEKVSLIVTMLDMPGMETEELCLRVRWNSELRSVSILLVCNNNPADVERCRGMKANGHITLPIVEQEFEERLVRFITVPKRKFYNVVTSIKIANRAFHCKMVNVSSTGMLVESSDKFENGAFLDLSFFLPGSEHIAVRGEVVRVLPMSRDLFHYGVRFQGLEPDMKQGLERFIQ